MKLLYLLLVPALLTVAACKKHDKLTPATPTVTEPATKDFRERYVGMFNVDKLHWRTTYSMGMPNKAKTSDSYIGTLQISYHMADSVSDLLPMATGGKPFSRPALTFAYGNGTKELLGIDTFGQLYRKASPGHPNYGGFITVDSISHASSDQGAE